MQYCVSLHDVPFAPTGSFLQLPSTGSHESTVQPFPSSQSVSVEQQLGVGVPLHWPLAHMSFAVQNCPSSQAVPNGAFCVSHFCSGSLQLPSRQLAFRLEQSLGLPEHFSFAHVSFMVQNKPSLHALVLAVYLQPFSGSHESSVHGLPSLQLTAVPPLHLP